MPTLREFEGFYRNVHRDLFVYVYNQIGHRETAQDVLGDVFRAIWQRWNGLDVPPENLRGWAFGVAKMVILRHRSRASDREEGEQRLANERPAQRSELPRGVAVVDLVESLIERVGVDPDDYAQILVLVAEGWKPTEIAGLMGMEPGTVRTRLSRLRIRIREHGLDSDWLDYE